MFENPMVMLGIGLAVMVGLRVWMGRNETAADSGEAKPPAAITPAPTSRPLLRLLALLGNEKLTTFLGDVFESLYDGNVAEANTRAEATLEMVKTPKGLDAALEDNFYQQLQRRLEDTEQRPKVVAKVKQYETKAA